MTNYAIFAADADINYYQGAPEVFFCSSCGSCTNSRIQHASAPHLKTR
ncbi:hypothetical protein PLUTE_b0426 [Pseudoalteromonas luteoviolacea DSM 6061]|nr:hypothetical protein [Pseudoalteromonas luteoviolacea DSM 6061]